MKLWLVPFLLLASTVASAQIQPRPFLTKQDKSDALQIVRFTALTLALADIGQTAYHKTQGPIYEYDPLARPIVNLPTPAFVSIGCGLAVAGYFVSVKLEHSQHAWLRKAAWILPIVSGGANAYGITSTYVRFHRQ